MAVQFTPSARIEKTITGKLAGVRGAIKFVCWFIPANPEAFERAEWGGEFVSPSPVRLVAEPVVLTTAKREKVNVILTHTEMGIRLGDRRGSWSAKFVGVGAPPKELYNPPPEPKHEPAKVRVVMARHHVNDAAEKFDSVREALGFIEACVDDNTAAPVWMEVPTTLIGASAAQFDTNQIYAMLGLVED